MNKSDLCILSFVVFSRFVQANMPEPGKQYMKMNTAVANASPVAEFFSFYCPPCRKFEEVYGVSDKTDKLLPEGIRTDKIHVSGMGPLGQELTEAWSVAKELGVEKQVQAPLFEAVQDKHSLKSASDIRQLFISKGIPAERYDAAINSFAVKTLTKKQNQAVVDFGVTGTPSFYVLGRYMIRLNGFKATSPEGYSAEFAQVVQNLVHSRDEH